MNSTEKKHIHFIYRKIKLKVYRIQVKGREERGGEERGEEERQERRFIQ